MTILAAVPPEGQDGLVFQKDRRAGNFSADYRVKLKAWLVRSLSRV